MATATGGADAEERIRNRMFATSVDPKLLPRLHLFDADFRPEPVETCLNGLTRPQKHLKEMMRDCQEFVEHSAILPKDGSVSAGDALALSLYTYEIPLPNCSRENVYYRLNALLRERSQEGMSEIYEWRSFIYHLVVALRKLPPYCGNVFRGIDKPVSKEAYARGRRICWNSFTSTADNVDVAKKFMKGVSGTFFTLIIKKGRVVKDLAPFNEGEVLLEANTEFQVVAFVQLDGITAVTLEEIDESTRPLVPWGYVARTTGPASAVPDSVKSSGPSLLPPVALKTAPAPAPSSSPPIMLSRSLIAASFSAGDIKACLISVPMPDKDEVIEESMAFAKDSAVVPAGLTVEDAFVIAALAYRADEPESVLARTERAVASQSTELEAWKPFLFHVVTAIRKCPVSEVVLFSARRVLLPASQFVAGKPINTPCFIFGSTNSKDIERLLRERTKGTVFQIHAKRARKLGALTAHPDQAYIMEANTTYLIRSCTAEPEKLTVVLEEIDSAMPVLPVPVSAASFKKPQTLFAPDYKPAHPLKECVKEINLFDVDTVIEDCQEFASNSAVYEPPLTQEDAFAIALLGYETTAQGKVEENLYARIERALQSEAGSPEQELLRPVIWHIQQSLRRCPVFQGIMYCGKKRPIPAKTFPVGSMILSRSFFMGARTEEDLCRVLDENGNGTVFKVTCKNAHSVSGLTNHADQDLFIEPYTVFAVKGCWSTGVKTTVELEEVGQRSGLQSPVVVAEIGGHKVSSEAQPVKQQNASVPLSLPKDAHDGVICDICGMNPIIGTRFKCFYCFDYDLCQSCVSAKRISKQHQHAHLVEEIAPGGKPAMSCPARPLGIVIGARVRRGRDWRWNDQDGEGEGTCVRQSSKPGWVEVRWDNGHRAAYRWGASNCYDLLIVSFPQTRIVEPISGAPAGTPATPDPVTAALVNPLWKWLVALHRNINPECLAAVELRVPSSLAEFYGILCRYEAALKVEAQEATWLRGGRRVWEAELIGARIDAQHAATLLLALRSSLLPKSFRAEWAGESQMWMDAVGFLGGVPLQYPEPSGAPLTFAEKAASSVAALERILAKSLPRQ